METGLELQYDEIGLATEALALHVAYGAEDPSDEDRVTAASIISEIATGCIIDPDCVFLSLDEVKLEVLTTSLCYGAEFHNVFDDSLPQVINLLHKTGDADAVSLIEDYKSSLGE